MLSIPVLCILTSGSITDLNKGNVPIFSVCSCKQQTYHKMPQRKSNFGAMRDGSARRKAARATTMYNRRMLSRAIPTLGTISATKPGQGGVKVYLRRIVPISTLVISGNINVALSTVNVTDQGEFANYAQLYSFYRVKSIKVQFIPNAQMRNSVFDESSPFRDMNPWMTAVSNNAAPTFDNLNFYVENATSKMIGTDRPWTRTWVNDMKGGRDNFVPVGSTSDIGGVYAWTDGNAQTFAAPAGMMYITYLVEYNSQQ